MFPTEECQDLLSYELMLSIGTRAHPLSIVKSAPLRRLRLSGDCILPDTAPMPNLRSLSLYGVEGNFFDRRTFEECFPEMHQLQEFSYILVNKTGFELRNRHLESLIQCSGHTLRKLVLLECNRLTTTVIADCLTQLPNLEYFALALVTVEELESNFLLSLPTNVTVLKLKVINAWYAVILHPGEKIICQTVEDFLQERPLQTVAMDFRSSLLGGPIIQRCKEIASDRGISFSTGPWVQNETI